MSQITPQQIINGIKQMLITANAITLENGDGIETTLDTKVLDDIIRYGQQQASLINGVGELFNSDLRNRFFKECTDSGINTGIRKVNMTAHDLFEWFRANAR